jgi:lipoyl(octanoyl) transferase
MAKAIWRLLLTPAAGGAQNMALDEALMSRARETGEFTLRVYSWAAPTLSLGRNQSARRVYDLERIRARGLRVVRRPTGGRAILHHREITYSVTAPAADAGDLHASYDRINKVLVAGLERLGVRPEIAAPAGRAVPPGPSPCFDMPSAGELVLGGRKLAGSAQWRSEGALLQHGSILVEDDQSTLAELTIEPQRSIPAPATLAGALGHSPSPDSVAEALGEAVKELEDSSAATFSLEPEIRARAAALVVQYEDDAWTWRR